MQTPAKFKKRIHAAIVHTCCYSLLFSQTIPFAYAGPTGAEVVGGSGTIQQSGNATTINQTTQNMSINWQSYNVNVDERVQYIQPNASSVSLNRILSNNGSTIAGRIDANGRVILVNPNGIFFTPTSVLNVGSLIASGLDINPNDFMNGQYIFNEIAGTNGTVTNSGIINASLGGNVALLGKQVKNDGMIVANLGTVSLAAGKQTVLTFDNDGLLGVRVSKEILQSELGVDPAIVNSGTIQAQGGKVLLTASQSQDIFSRAVNTNGIEQATSVVVHDDGSFTLGGGADVVNSGTIDTSTTSADQNVGRIVLLGENVTNSGTINANAQQGNGGDIELHARDMTLLMQNSITSVRSESNGKGGIVKVLGDKVGLFDQAKVDVSGANGGGQALIGGDFQGKNAAIRNATTTIVDRNTHIYADALQNGNGGKVILWADGNTKFLGNIFTRGGAISGNGGLVETSGKENLLFDGIADRTAVNGHSGVLLLDPRDITISTGTSTDPNTQNNGQISPPPTAPATTPPADYRVDFADGATTTTDFTITVARLLQVLSAGDVTLQANQDITVDGNVTTAATNAHSLTLEAGRDVDINNRIGLGNGNLTVNANNNITTSTAGIITTTGRVALTADANPDGIGNIRLEANVTANGGFTAAGVNFNAASSSNGTVTINTGTAGDATIGMTGNVVLGGMTVGRDLSVTAGASALTGISQGQANTANDILTVTGTSSFTSNSIDRDINLINNNDLRGLINVTTAGTYLANADIRNVSQTTTLGTLNVAGNLTVNAAQNLILRGTISGLGTDGNNAAVRTTSLDLNFGTAGGVNRFTATNATIRRGDGSAAVNDDRVNININGGADADTFDINNGSITTTNGAITIRGDTRDDTFNIASSIAGTINGNNGEDTFNINGAGINITSIDGGNGNDTLAGHDQANTWRITGNATGTLNAGAAPNPGIAYTGIQNLAGGNAADTFTFDPLGSLGNQSGWIDGGGDIGGTGDTLDLRNIATPVTVQWRDVTDPLARPAANTSATMTVARLNTITANPGPVDTTNIPPNNTNTLIGDDTLALTTWTIGGENSGNINGAGFSGFHNLTGGTQADRFVMQPQGSIGGLIDGGDGPGINTYDQSQLTTVRVNLNTGITGITRINNLIGNNTTSTLTGRDDNNDTWDITDRNSGSVAGITFVGFNNLIGGNGNDTYNIGSNTANTTYGSLTGTITDTAGNNRLNVDVTNIDRISGTNPVTFIGDGTDTVTITGTAPTDWRGAYTSAVTLPISTVAFDQIAYGNATSTSALAVNYQGANTVSDNATVADYRINGTTGVDGFWLGIRAGTNTFKVNIAVDVAYTNKPNLTIDGGADADSLLQTSGTTLSLPVASLTLANLEFINNGTALRTNLGSLSLIDSGPLTIREQDAITLDRINTTNLIDITAGGTVTSTAELTSTAAFSIRSTGDISLTGNNSLSGPISLQQVNSVASPTPTIAPNNTVTLNNTGTTTLAAINAGNLAVTSTGNIADTGAVNGAINVAGNLTMNTPGTITLDHANRIEHGSLTANEINLHTVNGIGAGNAYNPSALLNTTTSTLNVRNDTGNVLIANNGPVSASIITQGDIRFTNAGKLTVRQLNANGGRQTPAENLGGNIYLGVSNGSAVGNPATDFRSTPDIVAQNFFGNFTGDPRDMGESGRRMSILVRNEFSVFADNAYIYYFGLRPLRPAVNAILFEYVDIQGANNQQLIELETLDEIDPAIFTAVRNYYHEDVAIMLPKDQLLSNKDEEEGDWNNKEEPQKETQPEKQKEGPEQGEVKP